MTPFPRPALCLTALLLAPWALWGQSASTGWQASIAKVSVDPKSGRTPGTAFVVAITGQTAFLVTCAHVVVEESSPRIEFEAVPRRNFRATVEGREPGDNPRGLALLVVENVPPEVQALPLAATANPVVGERVFVAGFPRPGLRFLAPETTIAGYEGQDLTVSRETVEGFSGGPVLRGDSAIGIIYGREAGGYGTALVSDVVRTYLRGLKVPLDGGPRTTQPGVPPPPGPKAGDTRVNPVSGLNDVWIPPGTFTMGCSDGDKGCGEDEKPAHPVTLTKGFWMGQTEVTVGAYRRYSAATRRPMPPEPDFFGRALNPGWKNQDQPIVNVTFQEAADYCAWAGKMRLPTEAQWEYAARAGSRGARYGNLGDIAWHGGNSGSQPLDIDRLAILRANIVDYLKKNSNGPKEVGQKRPNAWNLYDMLGNVWEWMADWYGQKYYQTKERRDPQGPPGETYRVLRGGSWYNNPGLARASIRFVNEPAVRSIYNGFRCAGE